MKIIIPFISLFIGIVVGAKFFSTTETIKEVQINPEIKIEKNNKSFITAATNISNVDLLEYTKLKTMKEKYEKADEILGKIILLFLANIQLEMDKDVKKYFTSSDRPELGLKEKKKESLKVIPNPFEVSIKEKSEVIDNEEFSDIESKTTKFNLKEPYAFYKNAKSATELKDIFRVYGKFEGELYITKGKNKGIIDSIHIDIKLMQVGNTLKGDYISELRRSGVPYSTNRGSGENKQVKLISKPKKHLLLEMSPSSFLQIFPSNESEIIIGRFYDNDEYMGLVRLYKM